MSTSSLDPDQQKAITELVEHDATLLVAGMGAGKTVIAATAAAELLRDGVLRRVLVVTPKRVAEDTWPVELMRWGHLHEVFWGLATGTREERTRVLTNPIWSITIINIENLADAARKFALPDLFDGLIIDESDMLGNTGNAAFKALRKHLPKFKWRVCMTGTPASEDLEKLFGQMLIVDLGKTLGRRKQAYLDRYFLPVDYNRRQWLPREGMDKVIAEKVAPWIHVMPPYPLPRLDIGHHDICLPESARAEYRLLTREMALDDVTAQNLAVLSEKLSQAAGGAIYTDDGETRITHNEKWGALSTLLRAIDEPVIVVYTWRYQLEVLQAMRIPTLDQVSVDDWNAGRVPVLAIHPRSAGHGLNLQYGGHTIIWLTPPWSRRQWDQTNARLCRRDQPSDTVYVHVLVAQDTEDELRMDRIEFKADYHARFLEHLESWRLRSSAAPTM